VGWDKGCMSSHGTAPHRTAQVHKHTRIEDEGEEIAAPQPGQLHPAEERERVYCELLLTWGAERDPSPVMEYLVPNNLH